MCNLEEICFKIISFSGDGQSKILQGLKEAKVGEIISFSNFLECIKKYIITGFFVVSIYDIIGLYKKYYIRLYCTPI